MQPLIEAVKLARRLAQTKAFAPYDAVEIEPGPQVQSDEEIVDYLRNRLVSLFNPVGTCKMGQDDMAVVDEHLRVHGIKGLRIIDASIMPTIINANTNAPTIMIAEKAADLIREESSTTDGPGTGERVSSPLIETGEATDVTASSVLRRQT